jgi:hydroxyacylglutathione hydrolase
VSEGIDIIPVVVGLLEGNCYLVRCGDGRGVIIDPGDESDRIASCIGKAGLIPEAILLTHGHIDHTNGARDLKREFGCKVLCHHEDREMIEGDEAPAFWGLERKPCEIDQEITDGECLALGGTQIRVMHTPGHSLGSVCYILESSLFSGDVLFRGSIGRTDLPGGSERDMKHTLKTRITVLEGNTVVYPGHGPATTIEHEKMFNPFL